MAAGRNSTTSPHDVLDPVHHQTGMPAPLLAAPPPAAGSRSCLGSWKKPETRSRGRISPRYCTTSRPHDRSMRSAESLPAVPPPTEATQIAIRLSPGRPANCRLARSGLLPSGPWPHRRRSAHACGRHAGAHSRNGGHIQNEHHPPVAENRCPGEAGNPSVERPAASPRSPRCRERHPPPVRSWPFRLQHHKMKVSDGIRFELQLPIQKTQRQKPVAQPEHRRAADLLDGVGSLQASRRTTSTRLACGIANRCPPLLTISAGRMARVSGMVMYNRVPFPGNALAARPFRQPSRYSSSPRPVQRPGRKHYSPSAAVEKPGANTRFASWRLVYVHRLFQRDQTPFHRALPHPVQVDAGSIIGDLDVDAVLPMERAETQMTGDRLAGSGSLFGSLDAMINGVAQDVGQRVPDGFEQARSNSVSEPSISTVTCLPQDRPGRAPDGETCSRGFRWAANALSSPHPACRRSRASGVGPR